MGVGEASFVTISPTVVADLFPESKRGRVLGVFYLAIPVGSRWAIRSVDISEHNTDGGCRFFLQDFLGFFWRRSCCLFRSRNEGGLIR